MRLLFAAAESRIGREPEINRIELLVLGITSPGMDIEIDAL
jgi:hypothetical protein